MMLDPDQVATELADAYPEWRGLVYDEDWRDLARCVYAGPSMFYLEDVRPAWRRAQRETQARQFCAPCPVRGSCLVWALSNVRETGIWGGQTEDERDTTRRRMRRVRVRLRSGGYAGDNESLQAV